MLRRFRCSTAVDLDIELSTTRQLLAANRQIDSRWRFWCPRVGELLRGKEKRGCSWSWMEKSLLDPTAKVWIHQGHWLRANARRERNLSVKRWLRAQADDDRERRKRARWATLTPSSELCLELKGGFLSLSGKPVGFFKQTRSRDLRELGFT